jgi:hypothetical protein
MYKDLLKMYQTLTFRAKTTKLLQENREIFVNVDLAWILIYDAKTTGFGGRTR